MEAKTWQETILTEEQLKEKISPTITIGEQAKKSLELQAETTWKIGDEERELLNSVLSEKDVAITDLKSSLEMARSQMEKYFTPPDTKCIYCHKAPDGAMLTMGKNLAHADCVIRKLNELLDPDYEGVGNPQQIIRIIV